MACAHGFFVRSMAVDDMYGLSHAGAIFGIVGALVVFLQRHRDDFGGRGDRVVRSLGQSVALNIAFGVMTPSIDNWCNQASQ